MRSQTGEGKESVRAGTGTGKCPAPRAESVGVCMEPPCRPAAVLWYGLDLLVKRGDVGTGVFDDHRGRTACGDNVNFN
jgi:hypothetical protein